jgi:hypothetical protein
MFHSRDKNTLPKPTQSSTYKPLQISDEAVYDMAQHWYTAEEIADRFCISKPTLLAKWGDAFHAGKADGFGKPRMLLANILKGFSGLDPSELCRPDVPVHNLLKAIELHAKKYEGMGTRQTVVHEGLEKKYDLVESTPLIIEKP